MKYVVVLLVYTYPWSIPQVTHGTAYYSTRAACNEQALKVITELRIAHKDAAIVRCEERGFWPWASR